MPCQTFDTPEQAAAHFRAQGRERDAIYVEVDVAFLAAEQRHLRVLTCGECWRDQRNARVARLEAIEARMLAEAAL